MPRSVHILIPDTWIVDPKGLLGIDVDEHGRPAPHDEDLWQASKGTWLLDVGASRGYVGTAFLCHVIQEHDWRQPIEKVLLDTPGEVQAWVNRWVRRIP